MRRRHPARPVLPVAAPRPLLVLRLRRPPPRLPSVPPSVRHLPLHRAHPLPRARRRHPHGRAARPNGQRGGRGRRPQRRGRDVRTPGQIDRPAPQALPERGAGPPRQRGGAPPRSESHGQGASFGAGLPLQSLDGVLRGAGGQGHDARIVLQPLLPGRLDRHAPAAERRRRGVRGRDEGDDFAAGQGRRGVFELVVRRTGSRHSQKRRPHLHDRPRNHGPIDGILQEVQVELLQD
ncbi:hypothetical protein ACHAXS_005958 [Conticribra weissflogii]